MGCYSDGGAGSGNCKALSMAETTTSSTWASTNTETTDSTSTTTPHTTTETSTTSLHTTSETSTTSSAHTTTVTRTTVESQVPPVPEDSGSLAPDLLGAFVALLAAIGVELC